MSGVISSLDSCILPIQVCDSDLSLFVNSIVIERQVNFYYSKKYAQHFLSQPFFIILTFSRLKHQNYVSSTMRVSESTPYKVVALVSARSAAVAVFNCTIAYKITGLYFSNKIGVQIFLSKIKSTCTNQFWLIFPDFRLLLFTSWAVALAGASRLVTVEVKTPIPKRGPALVQLSNAIR